MQLFLQKFQNHKWLATLLIIVGVLVASFVINIYFAEAVVPVYCPVPCDVWNVDLSGSQGSVCAGWFVSKEFIDIGCRPNNPVDGQYWEAALKIWRDYEKAFTEWIRTGQDDFFVGGTEGSMFVTSPITFERDAADNQASIVNEELRTDAYDDLCRPYRDILIEGDSTNYGRDFGSIKNKARCTIALDADIVLEDYHQDFLNGGENPWATWYESGLYANFDATTLYTLLQKEKQEREFLARKEAEDIYKASDGFTGILTCEVITPEGRCERKKINTPGSIIQQQTSDLFKTELEKAILADEAAEKAVDAFTQLQNWIRSAGSQGGGLLNQGPIGPGGDIPPGGQFQCACYNPNTGQATGPVYNSVSGDCTQISECNNACSRDCALCKPHGGVDCGIGGGQTPLPPDGGQTPLPPGGGQPPGTGFQCKVGEQQCQSGFTCIQGTCVDQGITPPDDDPPGPCVGNNLPVGCPVNGASEEGRCASGHVRYDPTNDTFVCTSGIGPGQPIECIEQEKKDDSCNCQNPTQCTSGRCIAGKCAPKLYRCTVVGTGGACFNNSYENSVCNFGCPIGSSCIESIDCSSFNTSR